MCSCKFRDEESCVKTLFVSGKTESNECSFTYHENEDVTCNKFKEGKYKKQVFIKPEPTVERNNAFYKFDLEEYEKWKEGERQEADARRRMSEHYKKMSSYEEYSKRRN